MDNTWIKLDNYTAIRVSEYQDSYQLQKGNINSAGEIFVAYSVPTWKQGDKVNLKKKKAGGEYLNLPTIFNLGNTEAKAVDILKALIFQIEKP